MDFRSIKFWINVATICALGLLVVFAREQIAEAFRTLLGLKLSWLLLIIPIQLFNHYSVANFYKSYLKTFKRDVSTKELYKTSLEMNFVNNVFPSGGVSGFGYLSHRLKKLDVPASQSTLLQTSRHMLTFVSFIVYLMVALVFLSLFGDASRFIVLIATSLSFVIVFSALVLVYVVSDEDRIKQFTSALPKFANSVLALFHRKKNKQIINIERVEGMFGDLHKDYIHVRKNWKSLRKPFLWTMSMNLTEIVTIFVVYLSFAEIVNPGAIIISYAVANIAGLIAVLPGGVGIYEGLMTAVMTSAGVDEALALSATVVYRVFNMSLFLPIGYYFYSRALKSEGVSRKEFIEEQEK